jgi:hypothetical protein
MPLWGKSRRFGPASDEIVEYLQLLDDSAPEEKVQQFLEEHLSFWSNFMRDDTPCPLYAKVRLGSEYVVDFAFFDPSSDGPEWFLVEIERPGVGPMFLKNGDPSSKLMHAIHQVESWQDWVAANLPYAQQLMPQIDHPMGLVFFGRRAELRTKEARARLRAFNHRNRGHLQVRTLDSFIDGAGTGRAPTCARGYRLMRRWSLTASWARGVTSWSGATGRHTAQNQRRTLSNGRPGVKQSSAPPGDSKTTKRTSGGCGRRTKTAAWSSLMTAASCTPSNASQA